MDSCHMIAYAMITMPDIDMEEVQFLGNFSSFS
ncbi:hypothetical protein SAMN05216525_101108 [Bradyrhizobium sp. Gha]|nr:hypothetical protein SAMN05216525_101108 [Bradyrhizobium sp. Gha]